MPSGGMGIEESEILLRWTKSGVVVEKKGFDQYVVRMDGSGRMTLRNRRFMRLIEPLYQKESMGDASDGAGDSLNTDVRRSNRNRREVDKYQAG